VKNPGFMTQEIESLWAFSLRVYARPAVRAACLRLQDRHRLNVNLALFCCWYGRRAGKAPEPSQLQAAMAVVARWQRQVVAPIRRVRRRLKVPDRDWPESAADLRAQLQAVELHAEEIEQSMLSRFASDEKKEAPPADGRPAALAALRLYLTLALARRPRAVGLAAERDGHALIEAIFAPDS
jgi:uncharacterized protein (TIGR02444 family)